MESVKQTGLLIKYPSPNDYIAGGISGIPDEERILLGDWNLYLPTTEKQYRNGLFYSFDTLSCVTFSALNVVEMQVKYLLAKDLIDVKSLQYLKDAGYFDENGNFNCSDKFTAIMSGTTNLGNYFYKVWDSIRKDGLLPEKDLPMGDSKSFEEYHNPAQITDGMREKAKKILEILDAKYEWVFFDDNKQITALEKSEMENALTQAPLQIAIPVPGTHAVTLTDIDADWFKYFDHYEPFSKQAKFGELGIHFALKGYIGLKIKKDAFKYTFTKDLSLGAKNNDVLYLQKVLNNNTDTQVAEAGAGSPGKETNYFGPATRLAVIAFQRKYGIAPEGIVGPKTRAKLNELYGNGPIVTPPQEAPHMGKIDTWCEATKIHEGYFVGSRSYRNKNPGNLKYVGQKRANGKDPQNFCIFPIYPDGYAELRDMLVRCATGKSPKYFPEMSLLAFYQIYAPSNDGNYPVQYATAVARRLGVDIYTSISKLL